jgi:hypothetical protein
MSFFLWFSILIILVYVQNFIINSLYKNGYSFSIFLNINLNYSGFKKTYIKSACKFLNYSNLGTFKDEKFLLKSISLIFNERKSKFQVLVQFRPPLILLIVLTYLITWFVKLGINY